MAIGIDENIQASVVEMYDSSQQAWKVFGPIPEYRPLFDFGSFVCCDDSYYTIITEPWSVFGFTVTTVNEEPEPEPNPISILVVPIPEPVLRNLLEGQLVTYGLRLLLATPIEEIMGEQVITIFELESENKQCHPLSTNNRTPWAWKEIGRMPAAMFDVLHIAIFPRYKCIGVGDNVCFATVRPVSIDVVVYNLTTRSWSLLPSCPWTNHYWKNGYLHLEIFWPMVFQPRLDA